MDSSPARFLICPHCGTENLPDRETCLQCAQSLLLTITDENPWKPPVSKDSAPTRTFHLGTLMMAIALIAVCLGITVQWPGVGVILILIMIPATIRMLGASALRRRLGRPMRPQDKAIAFVHSAGVVTIIGVASCIAFVATCFPIGALAFNSNLAPMIVGAFIIGISAAILVVVVLGKRFWPWKD